MLSGPQSDQDRLEQGPRRRGRRAWTPLDRALTATGDRWTLRIALALAPGATRVTQLQRRLSGVSAGVLERHVQQMLEMGLITRTRFKEVPPRVELELTDAGRELAPVAAALARWGSRYLWSAPREHERVDLDALLLLVPVLLAEHDGLPEGTLDALISDADPPMRRRYRVQGGRLRLDGRAAGGQSAETPGEGPASAAERASASVSGDTDAWIAALAPAGERGRLHLDGDQRIASGFLDALSGQLARGLPQWDP